MCFVRRSMFGWMNTGCMKVIFGIIASVGALHYDFEKSVTQRKNSITHNAKNNTALFD